MKLEFHPKTVQDVNDAAKYYEHQRPGLATEFRSELNNALDRVAENPLLFPILNGHVRRCIVHRFPYSILYRVLDIDTVRVLVIRHHKRHPQFGLNRA